MFLAIVILIADLENKIINFHTIDVITGAIEPFNSRRIKPCKRKQIQPGAQMDMSTDMYTRNKDVHRHEYISMNMPSFEIAKLGMHISCRLYAKHSFG